MFRPDPCFQTFPGDVLFARGRNIFRDQHVQAVGLAIDVIVNPFQFLLDRFRRMHGRAEYAKTPARLTAATTSRQWLKASSGNSIPSMSQIGDS